MKNFITALGGSGKLPPPPSGHPPVARVLYYQSLYDPPDKGNTVVSLIAPRPPWGDWWRKRGLHFWVLRNEELKNLHWININQ